MAIFDKVDNFSMTQGKGRITMKIDHSHMTDGYNDWDEEIRTPAHMSDSDVITSLLPNGNHMAVLDIDIPHSLIPSSTEGHSHLYLDVEMSWRKYKRLLRALARAGVVEKGYVTASIKRGHTDVRLPWVKKGDPWGADHTGVDIKDPDYL